MGHVVENKYLPLHICEECLYELDRCYKFRNKCQLNDKKLKSHLRTLELKPQACPEEKRALEIAEKLLLKVMPKQVHANCEETELPMAVTLLPLALTIPPTQRLSCQQCGKTFVSAGSQRRHRLVHTGERPWVCPTCGRAFAQKVVLQRHRLVHLEKRPFACTECEKSFTQREALRAHTTTHLPPARRPMRLRTCPYCPKLFRHSSGLSRHLLVHTGRQFACRHCSRLFADKSSLRRHARTRHESPPPPQPLPPLPCERVAETTPP